MRAGIPGCDLYRTSLASCSNSKRVVDASQSCDSFVIQHFDVSRAICVCISRTGTRWYTVLLLDRKFLIQGTIRY